MFRQHILCSLACIGLFASPLAAQTEVPRWTPFEHSFTSLVGYENPLYDLDAFYVLFTSPSGRTHRINGFWDGDDTFRVRFAPDELGRWEYLSQASDEGNGGLHGIEGSFDCVANDSDLAIFRHGPLTHTEGTYHLRHQDGTPFLWIACTAWNGALKSTDEEWETYLAHRAEHGYSVIQAVMTQWRGAEANSRGEVAFEGVGHIRINPSFFQLLDQKIGRINAHGLVAAPVLLWALPVADGRELSPGYVLPLDEAVLLARYMVARFGAYQVVWILGGDGRYVDPYEQRWLEIGRRVFADDPPGLVAQHPSGRQWIGDNHAGEEWLDIVGYQSSHSNRQGTVDWINKGPIASRWPHLPARPVINLEPNYEEIGNIVAEDVRNASWWSICATPIAGVTYGANGIWPWIREGEKILNHRQPPQLKTWRESIDLPGSLQVGYLGDFLRQFEWWNFRPAQDLLLHQPGNEQFNHFIGVQRSLDHDTILAYVPRGDELRLWLPEIDNPEARWYDPREGRFVDAQIRMEGEVALATPPSNEDWVLILKKN